MMYWIGNHLWQSTLFAAAASLLTFLFRKNHAHIRHCLWLAASLKFLIPFALFIEIGSSLDFSWRQSPMVQKAAIPYFENISQPFGSTYFAAAIPEVAKSSPTQWIPMFLFAIWFCGFMAVLLFYLTRGKRVLTEVRRAQRLTRGRAHEALRTLDISSGLRKRIKLVASVSSIEPGVFGIFRPALLLPEGIAERLNDSELEAIIAHEVAHLRRQDNLTATVHMIVEALFWFHPMVWWIGAKLVQERENACDEEVLRLGKNPQSYAEGILKICEFYLESPLACVVGVIGADMKKRIQSIMAHRIGIKLSLARKLVLAVAGIAALALPIFVGLLDIPSSQAQSQPGYKPSFDEASVEEVASCGNTAPGVQLKIPGGPSYQPGGIFTTCSQLKYIIMEAYNIPVISPVIGVPAWSDDILYQIEAKADGDPDKEQMHLMVQSLLEDRFELRMHREMQETPVYVLTVTKEGPELQPATDEEGNLILSQQDFDLYRKREREQMGESPSPGMLFSGNLPGSYSILGGPNGHIFYGKVMNMETFATALGSITYPTTGKVVIDKTDLAGFYDIQLRFADPFNKQAPGETTGSASPEKPSAATVFDALQQQLGLKLEADTVPLNRFIVDSVQKPSDN